MPVNLLTVYGLLPGQTRKIIYCEAPIERFRKDDVKVSICSPYDKKRKSTQLKRRWNKATDDKVPVDIA